MEADKENCPPELPRGPTKIPTQSTSATSARPALQSVAVPALAFPAEDPDEDRDVLAPDGKTLRAKRSVLFYPSASVAAKFNQQPFSRSAAKRDSILALGSIGYLQHLYTKQGIANRSRPATKSAMQLAIGPAGEAMLGSDPVTSSSSPTTSLRGLPGQIKEEDEFELPDLPPSPKAAAYVRPRFLDVARPLEADTNALRALLVADLQRLSDVWQLADWIQADPDAETLRSLLADSEDQRQGTNDTADVLRLVDATTKAIRSVRSYLLALPQQSKIPTTSPMEPSGKDRYKRQSSFSGVSRPGQVGTAVPARTSEILHADVSLEEPPAQSSALSVPFITMPLARRLSTERAAEDDDLSTLRKAALEMLAALKEMEETHRVEALEADGGSHEQDVSLSATDASDDLTGATTTPVGYLYRQDLKLTDLVQEKQAIERYLKTANAVLSASVSGHEKQSSAVSQGQEHESHSAAAQTATNPHAAEASSIAADARGAWTASGLGTGERVWHFLMDHCASCEVVPAARLQRLRDTSGDLDALLALVSDGFLLCQAFNEVVRRSAKPWGYISSREMHDLEAEEAALLHKEAQRLRQAQQGEAPTFQTRSARANDIIESENGGVGEIGKATQSSRPGWTFRRTENLRVWAAALRLRHGIQTTATRAVAKSAAPGPTYGSLGMGKLALHGRRVASESTAYADTQTHQLSARTIDFDPAKVARRDNEWQPMLTTLLETWIAAVADESNFTS